jgi:hypothetical protein
LYSFVPLSCECRQSNEAARASVPPAALNLPKLAALNNSFPPANSAQPVKSCGPIKGAREAPSREHLC